jgi:hypothetical protein
VKNVIILLLLLGIVGLFFYDKQQTDDLQKARNENDQLTQQMAAYQSQYTDLQTKYRNLQASAQAAPVNHLVQPQSQPGAWKPSATLDGANPLDKPAYH